MRDVAAAIEAVPETLGRKGYAVYAPAGTEQVLRELFPEKFGLLLKAGDDLGDALFGATRDLLLAGHDCVLLVNGDSPTLPSGFWFRQLRALRGEGDRLVLGPASDGGYYLIGLKFPHRRLFTQIEWGTDTVFSRTCERAAEIGLATTLLPEWYDIDDVETLHWLQDELAGHSTRFRGGSHCFGDANASCVRAAGERVTLCRDRFAQPAPFIEKHGRFIIWPASVRPLQA